MNWWGRRSMATLDQTEIDKFVEGLAAAIKAAFETAPITTVINIWGEESFRKFVVESLNVLKERVDKVMADLDDVKQALVDIKASVVAVGDSVANIAADEAKLLQKITDLEAAQAGGTVVSAADMAGLKKDTADLRDSLAAAATSLKGIADAVPDVP